MKKWSLLIFYFTNLLTAVDKAVQAVDGPYFLLHHISLTNSMAYIKLEAQYALFVIIDFLFHVVQVIKLSD